MIRRVDLLLTTFLDQIRLALEAKNDEMMNMLFMAPIPEFYIFQFDHTGKRVRI